MVIGESPGKEELIMGEPFMGREGRWFRKMLGFAQLDPILDYLGDDPAGLWCRLKAAKPRLIMPLGIVVTSKFLRGKFTFTAVVGRFLAVSSVPAIIAPWHSPHKMMQGGRDSDEQTAQFLKQVKEKLLALDQKASQAVGVRNPA